MTQMNAMQAADERTAGAVELHGEADRMCGQPTKYQASTA
jgi:hypothetical protein